MAKVTKQSLVHCKKCTSDFQQLIQLILFLLLLLHFLRSCCCPLLCILGLWQAPQQLM